jgi:hypothetical protein
MVFSCVRFSLSLVFCVVFCSFVLFLLTIVLSVLLRFTASDYPFGILWPLCCLSFDLRLLITPLVSCGHCVVCPSSIYNRNAIFIDYSILNVRLLEFILNWYHNIEKAIYLCQLFIFRLSVFI